MKTEASTTRGLPDTLPLEFQAYMGKSAGRITIPPQLRSDLGITQGDIVQFTILAKKASCLWWLALDRV